jgi:hypothetical protein
MLAISADLQGKIFGETRGTGRIEIIDGISCEVVKIHFPSDSGNHATAKWFWYDAYRFTVPGWEECTITGRTAARRVIHGRTDPAVLNTIGINPFHNDSAKPAVRESVLDKLREGKKDNPPREPKDKTHRKDGPEL